MKKAESETMGMVITIIIAMIAAFIIISLVWSSVKNAADQTKVDSPLSLLKKTCEAKSYLPGTLDSDNDGVVNSCDVCDVSLVPKVSPIDKHEDHDTDKDGIPDACDKQPEIPGTFESDCKHIISVDAHMCRPE